MLQRVREQMLRGGFCGFAPAGETIPHAIENVRLESLRLRRGELEQLIQRRWIFLDVLGEPTGDEFSRHWQSGVRGEVRERRRISVSDGDQSIPDEQREVVVVRVLRVGEQRRSEVT